MGTLSRNVDLASLVAFHPRHGNIDNAPSEWELANLKHLAETILDPVIDRFGAVDYGSGFRCERLNRLVKGVPTSRHRTGEAVDFEPCDSLVSNLEVATWIRDNLLAHVDEVILEFYVPGRARSGWVHVAARRPPLLNAREVWTYVRGETRPRRGLQP